MFDDDYDDEYYRKVIIDNGSGYIKAGLKGEEGPRCVFPTCVGYPKYQGGGMIGGKKGEFYVGDDAQAKRGVLKLNYPIENGIINNWDDMEKIWRHIFENELRVAPEESYVLLTESSKYNTDNRRTMAQIMFEDFHVPSLYIANPAALSLIDNRAYTGIAIESGDGVIKIVPVFDFYVITHAIMHLDLAGRDLTEYMKRLLLETGKNFSTSSEMEIVKAIKEKACYVAFDFEKEIKSVEPYEYKLPDGESIIIKDQRIKCPEALFKPELIQKEGKSLPQTCNDSILKCDIDIRKELYYNIVLSGGTSMFNGLPERLRKEMNSFNSDEMYNEIRVIDSRDRKYSAWRGGNIISSISSFESHYITRSEYEEFGANIVHRKCF